MCGVQGVVATSVILLATAASTWAQSAAIRGRLTDAQGGAVANAVVVLTRDAAPALTTQSAGDGTFAFQGVPTGEHILRVEAPGFVSWTQTVAATAGGSVLAVTLDIAGVREDVTVRSEAPVTTIGRVSTPLSDQPLTVNTLTSEFLELHAINDLVVALQHVPNVNAYDQYGVYQYYTFRGFRESVQLVDGIRNEGNRVRAQLANVERVEVLKGPASVLYGGDALGATVNLVLKKPSDVPTYEFSVSAGRWDTYRGAFGAGGRLASDSVLYRVDIAGDSATNFRNDPWKKVNVTPTIQWQMMSTDRLEVRYSVDRNRLSGDSGIPLIPLVDGFEPDPTRTDIGDPLSRAVQGDGTDFIPNVSPDSRYNTPQDRALSRDQNVRVSYTHAFNAGVVFRNTLGYRHYNDEYFVAEFLDVTPPSQVNRGFLYFNHHRRPLTNQAELAGLVRLGIDHDFLVGWDFQNYRSFTQRRADANFNTTPIDLFDPVETHVSVDFADFPVTRVDHFRNRTNAVFFQDTLTVLPQLKVVVGGRFDATRRRNNRNPVTAGVETDGPVTLSESDKFTHREGLVYQPTAVLDLYAQHSTAFRPNFSIQPDGTPLEPEHGEQYEVGQRLHLLQGRIQVNAAVFHIEKRNVARSRPGGFFDQVGKLRSRGFEAELQGLVTPAWQLSVGYGFTAATFSDYATTRNDFSGNTPRRSPRHSVTFSSSYIWTNGLALMVSGRTISEQFLNDGNTVSFNPYGVLDVGGSYTRGRVQFALNLTNVTETQYFASSLGNRQLYPGQPFNILASLRVTN